MKKKLDYLVFAFLLSFIFTACGTKESDGQAGTQTQQTTVPSTQPTKESEPPEVQTTNTNKQEEEETMTIANDKEELEKQKECNMKQFREPKEGEQIAEIVVKDFGSIFVRFFKKAAPKAVENFVTHAKEGYYDGLTFHRVMKDFMIQGGDPSGNGTGGESIWKQDFEDEFSDDYYPFRGALCMANAGPNTNGSQFFIVQAGADVASIYTTEEGKQAYLQQTNQELVMSKEAEKAYQTVGGTPWLYQAHTVFGQMYKGYDVLDKIAGTKTDGNDAPLEKVIIETIKISKYK